MQSRKKTRSGVVRPSLVAQLTSRRCLTLLVLAAALLTLFTMGVSQLGLWSQSPHPAVNLQHSSSEYGGWSYDAAGLGPQSVVYGVGVGEDTSWDLAVMQTYGMEFWAFDPTPKAIAHVESSRATLGGQYHFTPEGLGVSEGIVSFTKPKNPNHVVSMRLGEPFDGPGEIVVGKVNTLKNWMKHNGHTKQVMRHLLHARSCAFK